MRHTRRTLQVQYKSKQNSSDIQRILYYKRKIFYFQEYRKMMEIINIFVQNSLGIISMLINTYERNREPRWANRYNIYVIHLHGNY